MSTLSVGTIKSTATTPPVIQNSSGTAIGTFCRAWVNFNGTGTVAIRASFNVSSITDNGTGDYTVNFTTAMSDANYATTYGSNNTAGILVNYDPTFAQTTSALRVRSITVGAVNTDAALLCVAIFR